MGEAKLKGIKGCRPLHDVQVDFTNVCAAYGAARLRVKTLEENDIPMLEGRLKDLQLELKASETQEKLKPGMKVDLPPGADLAEAPTPAAAEAAHPDIPLEGVADSGGL